VLRAVRVRTEEEDLKSSCSGICVFWCNDSSKSVMRKQYQQHNAQTCIMNEVLGIGSIIGARGVLTHSPLEIFTALAYDIAIQHD
jgi:hypothetical protein